MKKILQIFFSCIAIALAGLWAYVRYLEKITVFHPTRQIQEYPDAEGLPYEDVYFKTSDGLTLNGWLVKAEHARTTILYLHGNAGNISGRIEKLGLFHKLGVNIFMFDYRGYGRSQGHPTEHGIYEDAVAAYSYLEGRKDLIATQWIAYGGSLGGAAAVDLATRKKINALIVDSSFSSAADMARVMFPLVPSFFMQIKLDSLSKIHSVKVPKLFIHSPNDDLVPYRLGRKLFDAAPDPKEFLDIQGKHNDSDVLSKDVWLGGMRNFMEKYHLN